MNSIAKNLIVNATRVCEKNVETVVGFLADQLTLDECKEAKAFVTWAFSKGKKIGWNNIDQRFAEFSAA